MKKDKKHITLDMPEVKDIPGQEHVRPPRIREMEDVTASSADEEGTGITDELNAGHPSVNPVENMENADVNPDTDVTEEEKILLERSDRPQSPTSRSLEGLALDNTDGEDPLNEGGHPGDMGEDLDVPGAELDDDNEEIGEEDEENNAYTKPD
jgi:hypothetical protein